MRKEDMKIGDVVTYDAIPTSHMFNLTYGTWNGSIVGKNLTVTELKEFYQGPGFLCRELPGFHLPIHGTRHVSRATPASVVVKSRKDSKPMKFSPRTNKFVSNRVLAVAKDGPAAKGGVQVGDTILKVGKYHVQVNTKISDIVQKLGTKGAYRKITVKVNRGGKTKFCHVTLGRDNLTGKAILGIENNPKKVSKSVDVKQNWNKHAADIAASKASLDASAKATSERKALEASLARTKAEAQAIKTQHDVARDELARAKEAAVEDNKFLKDAKEELDAVQALLADMKGADALLKARALRADLRAKNLNSLEATTSKVNAYLNKQAAARAKEVEIAPVSVRRFSWKRAAAAVTIASTVIAGGAYAYLNFFTAYLG